MFTRDESFKEYIKTYPVVATLIGICILWFIKMAFLDGVHIRSFIENGAIVKSLVAEGEIHRMITAMFLHLSWTHLLFNVFCLYVFASDLEKILGKTKFLLFYFIAGIGSSAFVFFLGEDVVTAGASGAIFGVFALYVFMIVTHDTRIPEGVSGIILPLVAINFVMTFVSDGVSLFGHLGGFVVGFMVAPLFRR